MQKQAGLSDRTRFEAFSLQWRDTVLREAGKWCADEGAKQLLADAVLADFRRKYAESDPPSAAEFFLRAQVCTVYSLTGQNRRRLEIYIAERALPDQAEAGVEPAPQAETPQVKAPQTETPQTEAPQAKVSQTETPQVKAPQTEIPQAEAAQTEPTTTVPAQEAAPAPAPIAAAPVQAPAAAPTAAETPVIAERSPEKEAQAAPHPAVQTPDTFLDPVRTTLWTPDSERHDHFIQEIELPDEEESERSVAISFLNTILFLLTVGAFSFCFYETGFLQYLLQ